MTIRQQGGVFGRHPKFESIEVSGEADLSKAVIDNVTIDGNSVTATSGDLTLDATSGHIVQDANISSASKAVVDAPAKTGVASNAVLFSPYAVNVSSNSTARIEVDLTAIEQTGYVGTVARKYIFSARQRGGALTASAVTDAADFSFTESSGNYAITPSIAVTIVDANNLRVDITLTKGGAIGWNTCLYSAAAKVISPRPADIT